MIENKNKEQIYKEFVVGEIKYNRNNAQISKVDNFDAVSKVDCYSSICTFDEGFPLYVEKTKSVEQYSGVHISETLPIDFDVPEKIPSGYANLNLVKDTVINYCISLQQVYEVPINYLRIYFSGMKGFTVYIPIEAFGNVKASMTYAKIMKSVVDDMTGEIKYVDKSIYHTTALLRMPQSIHGKTNYYKTPITFEELTRLSMQEIHQLAISPREIEWLPITEIAPVSALQELYEKWSDHFNNNSSFGKPKDIALSNDWFSDVINGVDQSKRNVSAIKLSGKFIEKNLDEKDTIAMLRIWNERNSPPMEDNELTDLVEAAYRRYSNSDSSLSVNDVYDFKKASEYYLNIMANIDQKKVLLGYPSLDSKMRGILPGETLSLQGKTGMGKSGLSQGIAHNYAKQSGEPVLNFSLEMPITNVIERAYQLEMDMAGLEVENMFKEAEGILPAQAELLFSKIPNIYTITKSGLDLQMIKKWIKFAEDNIYHKKTGLVIVDYLGLVSGKGNNLYEKVSEVARGMKDLAKECDVPVIFLTQVTKAKGELDIDSARDSGSIAEASDFIISLNPSEKISATKDIHHLNIMITKNRKGGIAKIPFTMNKKTLRFEEDMTVSV